MVAEQSRLALSATQRFTLADFVTRSTTSQWTEKRAKSRVYALSATLTTR